MATLGPDTGMRRLRPIDFWLQRPGLALADGPMSTSGSPGRAHCEALIRCA